MQTKMRKIIFVATFVILFFAVRVHFYQSPLSGEEGIFAELFLNQTDGSDFILTARVDSVNIYGKPMHPNMLYNTIEFFGILSSPLINHIPRQDNKKITPALRLLFSIFQFIVLSAIAIFLVLRKSRIGPLIAMIFLAVTISPLAIDTSANLQVDGSVGVLMNGLFAMAILLVVSSTTRNTFSYIMLFFATFFLATGKQEWSVVLVVALFLTAIYSYYIRKKNTTLKKPDTAIAIAILSGLAAGHIFSYLIGPQNYMGAFNVLWEFSRVENLLSGQVETGRWIKLTSSRLRWICTLIALAAISGIIVFRKLKELSPLVLMIWLYGLGLFGGYFISNWNHESRYFAPALVTLTIATVAIFPSNLHKYATITIIGLILMMFATSGLFLYNNIVKKPRKPYFDAAKFVLEPGQIAILSTADAWNKPDIDFVNLNVGKKSAERTAEKYNKTLYPENFAW